MPVLCLMEWSGVVLLVCNDQPFVLLHCYINEWNLSNQDTLEIALVYKSLINHNSLTCVHKRHYHYIWFQVCNTSNETYSKRSSPWNIY